MGFATQAFRLISGAWHTSLRSLLSRSRTSASPATMAPRSASVGSRSFQSHSSGSATEPETTRTRTVAVEAEAEARASRSVTMFMGRRRSLLSESDCVDGDVGSAGLHRGASVAAHPQGAQEVGSAGPALAPMRSPTPRSVTWAKREREGAAHVRHDWPPEDEVQGHRSRGDRGGMRIPLRIRFLML
jgi:hypothetical protein